jgi:hypothetical protein
MKRLLIALVVGVVSALVVSLFAVGVYSGGADDSSCLEDWLGQALAVAQAPLELAQFGTEPLYEAATGEFRPPANLRERLLAERSSRSTDSAESGTERATATALAACLETLR